MYSPGERASGWLSMKRVQRTKRNRSLPSPGLIAFVLTSFILAGFTQLSLAADRMEDLGLVQTWVPNTSLEARQAVTQEALAEVILRLSGDRAVLNSQVVADIKSKASKYLVAYSYHNPTSDQLAYRSMLGLPGVGLWLELRFEYRALIDQLREQGILVWGDIRPRIVLWWAQQEGSLQSTLSSESSSQLLMTLRQTARRRGIPLVIPRMDEEDAKSVSAESVLGFRASEIRKASRRYNPDATVVVGVKRYGPNFWEGDWQLSIGESTFWFEGQGQTADELAVLVIEQIADQMASLYSAASTVGDPGRLHLKIVDVSDYHVYKEVNAHLTRLSMVKQLHLVRANGRELDYLLMLDGSIEAFENALSLGAKLVAKKQAVTEQPLDASTLDASGKALGEDVAAQDQAGSSIKTLEYYWVGP